MDSITIRRQLLSAVSTLGADPGTIEQRLRRVYEGELSQIAGLTAEAGRDYDRLMAELAELLGGQSRFDLKRASALAKRVVALYERVISEA